jgi:hypothetical protein
VDAIVHRQFLRFRKELVSLATRVTSDYEVHVREILEQREGPDER